MFLSLWILCTCKGIDQSKEIAKSWKVVDIRMVNMDSMATSNQDQYISVTPPATIIYQFNADGTYTIDHAKQIDQGTWLISKDQKALLLTSSENPADNASFIIEHFESYKMVISTDISGVKEFITLEAMD